MKLHYCSSSIVHHWILCAIVFCAINTQAQLAITVFPPKIVGQKAVVKLAMKNNLSDKVESARAVCFLLDEQGAMVGQSTKWVIGGTKDRPPLEPKSETTFNFVVSSLQPFTTTNLTAKISFSRVVLDGNKLADPKKDVHIQNPQ
jgi:hypothetical protein